MLADSTPCTLRHFSGCGFQLVANEGKGVHANSDRTGLVHDQQGGCSIGPRGTIVGCGTTPGKMVCKRFMELTAVAGTCMGTELQSTHRRHYVRRQYRHSGRMSSLSLPCSIPCLPSS